MIKHGVIAIRDSVKDVIPPEVSIDGKGLVTYSSQPFGGELKITPLRETMDNRSTPS